MVPAATLVVTKVKTTPVPPSARLALLEVMQQATKTANLLIYNEIIANYTMKFSKNPVFTYTRFIVFCV